MKTFLIVGYGNTLRGDDGLGPLVTQQIAEVRKTAYANTRVATLPQLDISLVSDIKEVDAVIFVDARQDEDTSPVTVKRIEPMVTSAYASHTTHCLGAAALLGIVRDWYGKKQPCYMVMPKGYDFNISDKISARGYRSAARAIEIITEIIYAGPGVVISTSSTAYP